MAIVLMLLQLKWIIHCNQIPAGIPARVFTGMYGLLKQVKYISLIGVFALKLPRLQKNRPWLKLLLQSVMHREKKNPLH